METKNFYRVGIKLDDPSRLSKYFQERLSKEINKNRLYLGIRFNLVPEKQAAAISSMELALRYIELAKDLLSREFGEVSFYMSTHFYTSDFQKSIIDADSTMLLSNIEDKTNSAVQAEPVANHDLAVGA
ncbi:MAG: hypothetical protein ACN4GM_00670 [Gammaproteobacteria bacterium]